MTSHTKRGHGPKTTSFELVIDRCVKFHAESNKKKYCQFDYSTLKWWKMTFVWGQKIKNAQTCSKFFLEQIEKFKIWTRINLFQQKSVYIPIQFSQIDLTHFSNVLEPIEEVSIFQSFLKCSRTAEYEIQQLKIVTLPVEPHLNRLKWIAHKTTQ